MKSIAKMIFWIMYFLYIAAPIKTARILAIIPIPSYSHQIPYRLIWATLSKKGHEVTVLTTDPMNDHNLTNLTEINFQMNYNIFTEIDLNFAKNFIKSQMWLSTTRTQLWAVSRQLEENIYNHPEVRKMYAPHSNQTFDVILVETFLTPSLYVFAHRFNAPLIGITTFGLVSNNYYMLGAPILPSHPATWELEDKTGFNLSFWQRTMNFIYQWYHIYCILNYFYPEQQKIAEKYLGKNIPDIIDIEKNMSIVLVNQQDTLSYARPKTPNVISYGNLHILKKPAPLPKELREFVNDAPNGFIYMSLGTNVLMSAFPKDTVNIFRDVFASLPYKILWKHDSKLINKTDNIYIAKWFPQQSLLAHPNIKLFIYQGGFQSTEEAVYYTVPILGMPVLADQFSQVNKMVSLGVAKRLNILKLSREYLNASITDMLNDKKYKENMRKVKVLNEDKPYDLLEHVIWWIEFVIRYKGAPHLHTTIAHDPWYQKYEMDVIAILSITIFLALICTLIIIYKLLKIILRSLRTSMVSKEKIN